MEEIISNKGMPTTNTITGEFAAVDETKPPHSGQAVRGAGVIWYQRSFSVRVTLRRLPTSINSLQKGQAFLNIIYPYSSFH